MSSVFFLVEPSKIIFFIQNTIPQKEDIILLYIGYHSIPEENTTQMGFRVHRFSGSGYSATEADRIWEV